MKGFDCVGSGSDLIVVKLDVVGDMFFLQYLTSDACLSPPPPIDDECMLKHQ